MAAEKTSAVTITLVILKTSLCCDKVFERYTTVIKMFSLQKIKQHDNSLKHVFTL
jgi:hypothetical protein